MGIYDDLDNQTQPLLYINILLSHVIIFGNHMTGKTTFLKTMLVRMHQNIQQGDKEETYIIDFGGNIGDYADLPLVSACFDSANEENVRRIFRTVENKLEKNIRLLRSSQCIDAYYNQDMPRPTHLTLIIDNVNSFLADERYMSYQEDLLKFCRDGLSKGLSVVFTASDVGNGLGRFMGNFGKKFVFDVDADKYIEILGMKIAQPMKNPGRGVSIIDGKPREFQAFLPFENDKEELGAFISEMSNSGIYKAEKLQGFDQDLTFVNFFQYCSGNLTVEQVEVEDNIAVGLDYYEHLPVTVNLKEMHSIAIYGKKRFGKTNLVKIILQSLRRQHPDYVVVLFDDGRNQLGEFHLENDPNSVYINNIDQLKTYLESNGYASTSTVGRREPFKEKDTPVTVFVLQNKILFQSIGKQLLKTFSDMTAKAEEKGYYFIYSDLRKISNNDRETESYLNNSFSVAFLLDNISEFVADKGSRSVFGEMDAKDLKNEYARCELGDGYFYDIESDELKKVKIIKA